MPNESSPCSPYVYRWQKARAGHLRNNPLCAECLKRGIVTPATIVDHIVPHRGDQALFWDPNNRQSMCKHCHDSHKQRLEKSGQVSGCDVNGVPIDPRHHWQG